MAVIKQSLPDLPAAATVALADERREHVASRAAVQSCSPELQSRVNSYRLLSKNESVQSCLVTLVAIPLFRRRESSSGAGSDSRAVMIF